MAHYQILYWVDIPVQAKAEDSRAKAALPEASRQSTSRHVGRLIGLTSIPTRITGATSSRATALPRQW